MMDMAKWGPIAMVQVQRLQEELEASVAISREEPMISKGQTTTTSKEEVPAITEGTTDLTPEICLTISVVKVEELLTQGQAPLL